jgi:DNA polymerase (family 10)
LSLSLYGYQIPRTPHHTSEMENMRYEVRQLRRAWLTKEEVVNTLSAYEFLVSLRPPAT